MTVIWGDVIQMIILFLGIIICLFCGLNELGGIEKFIELVDKDRLQVVNFEKLSFTNSSKNDEFGFWPMIIGGFFLYASYYGTDQTQSQRLLSSKNMVTAKAFIC